MNGIHAVVAASVARVAVLCLSAIALVVCDVAVAGSAAPLDFSEPRFYGLPHTHYGLAVGDLDADGRRDLVTAQIGDELEPRIDALAARAWGRSFVAGADIRLDGVGGVALADLNADGRLDVMRAATSASGSEGQIALGLGDGRGGLLSRTSFGGFGNYPGDLAVADFNRDGTPDVAVSENSYIGERP